MKKDSTLFVLLFMVALFVLFGACVATVHYATSAMLKENELMHNNSIVADAFSLTINGKSASSFKLAIETHLTHETIVDGSDSCEVFRSNDGAVIGFIFSGLGFWDVISGIIVLSSDLSTIHNIRFLDQKETPGLGARIEERAFTDQFKGLRIDWNAPVQERIIIGSSVDPEAKNRVDAITGATQTSLALGTALNESLDKFKNVFAASNRSIGQGQ